MTRVWRARRAALVLVALFVVAACQPPPATSSPSPSPEASPSATTQPSPTASTTNPLDMTPVLLAKPIPYADGFGLRRTISGRDGVPAKGFEPVRTTPPAEDVGTERDFWVADLAANKFVQMRATLRLVTDHVKWWAANTANVDPSGLRATANSFETKTYPTDRRLFGEEWSPGIDADPRINVLLARFPGAAGGYFGGSDEEPAWVNPYSNEREMIYINTLSGALGSANIERTMAHEFCHMIQFNTRRRSAVWFNEGHGVLCEQLNGFKPTDGDVYLRVPDTQLNDWSTLELARPHYGLAYMFLEYLRQHAGGEDLIRALMRKGIDNPEDLDAVLKERGQPGIEEQYAAFVAANAFIGTSPADPKHGYPQGAPARQPGAIVPGDKVEIGGTFRSNVHQYAVRYIELPRGNIRLTFEAPTTNRIIATEPHSGRSFWWSDKGDGMDASLTKTVDLRSASDLTLKFWTWYQVEQDFDYAYVLVSTDDGAHWTPLRTDRSTTTDPNGLNYGQGITGGSGGETATGWRPMSVDLSPYAGKMVKLRFQYVTDGNFNLGGFAIDDIEIPGMPLDDAEADNGWTASGFVRSTNVVAQRHTVQVLRFGGLAAITRTTDSGRVTIDVDTTNDPRTPLLAVTGWAVRTTEPTSFTVTVEGR
jgi:hypothetical protein